MDKSDAQELVTSLYLRLNGYFVSGFIVHDQDRVKTELDVLAVRFPRHDEPERETQCCAKLRIPTDTVDFLVGEVKGGQGAVNFNERFRSNPAAIATVLRRFGAFDHSEIGRVEQLLKTILDPGTLRKARSFPSLEVVTSEILGSIPAKLRFIPFAGEQCRPADYARPYVFVDDMLNFIWACFRPEQRRVLCDDHYNYDLWGPELANLVYHFKDPVRREPGTIEDVYAKLQVGVTTNSAE